MGKHYRKSDKKSDVNLIISIIAVICVLLTALSLGGFYMYRSKSNIISKNTKPVDTNIDNVVLPPLEKEITPSEEIIENPKDQVKEVSVLISSVGDCTIGTDTTFSKNSSLPAIVQKNDNDLNYLFSNVSHIFGEDDITIANLETTFTTATEKKDKKAVVQYHFKGDPMLAESLAISSIEGVNLSNNHIYDYGTKGFKDTIDALKSYNISYFGEGNKWIKEVNGVKFGFLGYQGWADSKELRSKLKKDIEELKTEVSLVVVSFHWGEERKYTPNSTQRSLAHISIDNGADLVIGHHPHVIQGIEKYKDRFIAYSLGNFCFGGNSNPKDKDTLIFQTDFKFENLKLKSLGIRAIPCSVSSVPNHNDYKPTPLAGVEKLRLLDKLNKLNINLGYNINDSFNYINVTEE